MARWLRLAQARYHSIASALVHVCSDNSLTTAGGAICWWTCTQCRSRNRTKFTRWAPRPDRCSWCKELLLVHPDCAPEALAPDWLRA